MFIIDFYKVTESGGTSFISGVEEVKMIRMVSLGYPR